MKKQKTILADVTARRDAAVADEVAAREAIAKFETDRAECIRRGGSDDEIDRIEEQIKAEQRRAERATARIEVLGAEVEVEARRAAESEQLEREARANAAADTAAQKLAVTFEQIRASLHDAMRTAAQADLLIEAANRGIGSAKEALPTVEARCRAREPLPRRILSEAEVVVWCYVNTGHRLSDEQAARVRLGKDGRGFVPMDDTSYPVATTSPANIVERRKFTKRTFVPAQRFPTPSDLAETLHIPGFRAGDLPIWEPVDFSSPEAVLERLAAVERHTHEAQSTAEIEFIPIDASANVAA
jgi:hypothetical protein